MPREQHGRADDEPVLIAAAREARVVGGELFDLAVALDEPLL